MPSDRKKKAAATKGKPKAATSKGKPEDEASAAPGEDGEEDGAEGSDATPMMSANASAANLEALGKSVEKMSVQDTGRSCTGVLSSHPQSRDVHVSSFTLLYHGHELLVDADLELNFGRWGDGLAAPSAPCVAPGAPLLPTIPLQCR